MEAASQQLSGAKAPEKGGEGADTERKSPPSEAKVAGEAPAKGAQGVATAEKLPPSEGAAQSTKGKAARPGFDFARALQAKPEKPKGTKPTGPPVEAGVDSFE